MKARTATGNTTLPILCSYRRIQLVVALERPMQCAADDAMPQSPLPLYVDAHAAAHATAAVEADDAVECSVSL
jgi:hypothetical protein